jgi:hypothetical protein
MRWYIRVTNIREWIISVFDLLIADLLVECFSNEFADLGKVFNRFYIFGSG